MKVSVRNEYSAELSTFCRQLKNKENARDYLNNPLCQDSCRLWLKKVPGIYLDAK